MSENGTVTDESNADQLQDAPGSGNSDAADGEQPTTQQVILRRAPKFPAFLILGGGLGAAVTYILTGLFPVDPTVGFGALFAYAALYGITAGVVLGALVAIVLDRIATARAKTHSAQVTVSRPTER